jgi:hypothetical protein
MHIATKIKIIIIIFFEVNWLHGLELLSAGNPQRLAS